MVKRFYKSKAYTLVLSTNTGKETVLVNRRVTYSQRYGKQFAIFEGENGTYYADMIENTVHYEVPVVAVDEFQEIIEKSTKHYFYELVDVKEGWKYE